MSKTRKLLPKLRKISYKNKKHHYKLKDPFFKRKLAIIEGVEAEARQTKKTMKKAAIAKKGRFNILRIYRKYKKVKECNIIVCLAHFFANHLRFLSNFFSDELFSNTSLGSTCINATITSL